MPVTARVRRAAAPVWAIIEPAAAAGCLNTVVCLAAAARNSTAADRRRRRQLVADKTRLAPAGTALALAHWRSSSVSTTRMTASEWEDRTHVTPDQVSLVARRSASFEVLFAPSFVVLLVTSFVTRLETLTAKPFVVLFEASFVALVVTLPA